MNQFDKILQIHDEDPEPIRDDTLTYQSGPSSDSPASITRSSTESYLAKSNSNSKSVSSPRFRPKTHSQVLKAASSIPSRKFYSMLNYILIIYTFLFINLKVIFSNKSLKLQKSTNNFNYEQSGDKLLTNAKKNSIDDDFFCIGSNKTRRSPLRFLGNLVDDKIFRGKWSSTKRAKSTDEITWALANEDLIPSEMTLLKKSIRNRKISLGVTSTSSNNTDDTLNKKRYKHSDKNLSIDAIGRKMFDDGYNNNNNNKNVIERQKLAEIKKKKSSNTSSDMHSISGSSAASLNDHGHFINIDIYPLVRNNRSPDNLNEIRAETLAEIEVCSNFQLLIQFKVNNILIAGI